MRFDRNTLNITFNGIYLAVNKPTKITYYFIVYFMHIHSIFSAYFGAYFKKIRAYLYFPNNNSPGESSEESASKTYKRAY